MSTTAKRKRASSPRQWVRIDPHSEYGEYLAEIVAAWEAPLDGREFPVRYTRQKVVEDLVIGELLGVRDGTSAMLRAIERIARREDKGE